MQLAENHSNREYREACGTELRLGNLRVFPCVKVLEPHPDFAPGKHVGFDFQVIEVARTWVLAP